MFTRRRSYSGRGRRSGLIHNDCVFRGTPVGMFLSSSIVSRSRSISAVLVRGIVAAAADRRPQSRPQSNTQTNTQSRPQLDHNLVHNLEHNLVHNSNPCSFVGLGVAKG